MSTHTNLNQLEQIKKITTVVADTADFESIRAFRPQDATTNPSLVYAATQKENYSHFLDEVLTDRRKSGLGGTAQLEDIIDHLLVRFGSAMLEIVPGRVSTETDVRYSFDVEGSRKPTSSHWHWTKRSSGISSTKTQWPRRKPRKEFANSEPISPNWSSSWPVS